MFELLRGVLRHLAVNRSDGHQGSYWDRLAARIISCPEYALLPMHSKAGMVEDGRQYFFDGSVTVYPWSDHLDLLRLVQRVRGASEPQEIVPFLKLVQALPPDTVSMELGAGWGLYSILLGRRLPKASLVLVEANPRLIAITRQNMQLNGLADRSRVIHAAASSIHNGEVRFSEDGYGSSIRPDGCYEVPSCSVDGLMKDLELRHLGMVHMDVQGAELDVLSGMQRALESRTVDSVFIGTHSLDLHCSCREVLLHMGYYCAVDYDLDSSVSGDGILVAVRDMRLVEICVNLHTHVS